MEEELLFQTLVFESKLVKDCRDVYKVANSNIRIFVFPKNDSEGFDAIALEFVSCVDSDADWECKHLRVLDIFRVSASFDGIRHLYFNQSDENCPGYFNYPNSVSFISLFEQLRDIEIKYCPERKYEECAS